MQEVLPNYRNAHLWRHDNGFYYAVWREDDGPRRRSLRTKRFVEAERKLAGLLARAAVPEGSRGPLTVHQAAGAWLKHKRSTACNLSKATLREYTTFCARVAEFWREDAQLEQVTTDHVYAFLEFLETKHGLTRSGIKKRLGLLKSLFKHHRDLGNASRNPAGPVQLRGVQAQHTAPLPEGAFPELLADLEAFLQAGEGAQDLYARQGLIDAVVVLRHSGLRSIDIFRVPWEDIDLEGGVGTIRRPANKGGTRTWPIHPAVREVLEARFDNQAEGPFPARRAIQSRWRLFRDQHPRWAPYTFHSLRYAFVTALREAGLDWAAMQLAGHRTEAMSAHYTRSEVDRLREALQKL